MIFLISLVTCTSWCSKLERTFNSCKEQNKIELRQSIRKSSFQDPKIIEIFKFSDT